MTSNNSKKGVFLIIPLIIFSTISIAQIQPVCFTTPTVSVADSPSVGTNPNAVVSADFNGDGKLDLASVNYSSNDISILLNTGVGSINFSVATNYSVGLNPTSIATADFNNDGFKDLAVTNFNLNTVSILLGNGTGGFGAITNFGTGTGPQMVIVGDFNSDTKQDLAIANYSSNDVSILLGNGSGGFNASSGFAVGANPKGLTIGDFNNDSRMDIITANSGTNTVSYLAGNGAGSFAVAVNISVTINAIAVVSGDFDSNGKLDLAVVQQDLGYFSVANGIASILFGNGSGGFGTATNYSIGSATCAKSTNINSTDINSDSKMDIVITNNITNEVSVLIGSTSGTFSPIANIGTGGASPSFVCFGDFDGDTKKDIAITNYASNNISILRGNGLGLFLKKNYALSSLNPKTVQSFDFNGDGNMDILTSNNYYVPGGSGNDYGNVSVLFGDGMGKFTHQLNYNTLGYTSNISIADFNGDLKKDILFSYYNSPQIGVLLGNSFGIFSSPAIYSPIVLSTGKNKTGDFNMDGKTDVAITNFNNTSILLGLGTGSFAAAVNYPTGTNPSDVAIGDYNNDGKQDLAITNSGANSVSLLFGSGTGTFGTATNYAVSSSPNSVVLSDLNNDGKLDLATANGNSNNVSVLYGSITGTFSSAINYQVDANPVSLIAMDFNSDGYKDIVTANYNSSDISILLGTPSGTFEPMVNIGIGYYTTSLTSADFNNDGKFDMAVATVYNITILLNSLLPTITSNSGVICANDGYTLSPSGGISYMYSSGTNTVNPIVTSSYTIIGMASNGCTNTAISSVTVIPQPIINLNSGAICNGQTFTLTASGAATYIYSSGTTIVNPSSTSSYTVIGTSTQGCTNTAVSDVTVNPIPTITVNSGSICMGSSFTMTPVGALTYNYSSGTNIVNPTSNTTFYVTGTSAEGCVNTTPISCSVIVNSVPTISVNSATICSGQTYSIIPTGAYSYTLTTPFSGITTTNTYWLFGPTTSETYTIVGESMAGCISSNTVLSSVLINTTPTITVNNGVICSGKSFTINPSGAATYSFSSGSSIVSPSVNVTYTVFGTSSQNCISTSVISNVTVNSLPNLIAGSSNSITCPGQMAFLSVNGTNSYTWSTGSQLTIISITPTITTSYTVAGTDANGCTNTSVVTQSVDACTGIENTNFTKKLLIYPNPTNDYVYVDFEKLNNAKYDIKLSNTLGQDLIYLKDIDTHTFIDFKNLANSVYFLSIIENEKMITIKKIIKN